jgi:hypothetical protein
MMLGFSSMTVRSKHQLAFNPTPDGCPVSGMRTAEESSGDIGKYFQHRIPTMVVNSQFCIKRVINRTFSVR